MTWLARGFFCPGLPATKGSLRAVRRPSGGSVLVPDNARTKPWQRALAMTAHAAGVCAQEGPVAVELVFYLPRPARQVAASGHPYAWAPLLPLAKPDLDKLARAVLDGLTGVAWKDDAQVTTLRLEKRYAVARAYAGPDTEAGVSVQLTPDREAAVQAPGRAPREDAARSLSEG
jgi:Holliday junction resolvase RusA-like endonuclease